MQRSLTVSDGGEEGLGTYARTHGFRVNTTRDLGSSNWPIRFENTLAISRDRNGAVWRLSRPEIVTVLEESTISWVYKLCPKQTEAVLAFVCRYDVSVSPPKGTHSAEDKYNLVLPAMITAVAFVIIVHAGSGKSRCLLLSTFSLSYGNRSESINVKVNSYFKHCWMYIFH